MSGIVGLVGKLGLVGKSSLILLFSLLTDSKVEVHRSKKSP